MSSDPACRRRTRSHRADRRLHRAHRQERTLPLSPVADARRHEVPSPMPRQTPSGSVTPSSPVTVTLTAASAGGTVTGGAVAEAPEISPATVAPHHQSRHHQPAAPPTTGTLGISPRLHHSPPPLDDSSPNRPSELRPAHVLVGHERPGRRTDLHRPPATSPRQRSRSAAYANRRHGANHPTGSGRHHLALGIHSPHSSAVSFTPQTRTGLTLRHDPSHSSVSRETSTPTRRSQKSTKTPRKTRPQNPI